MMFRANSDASSLSSIKYPASGERLFWLDLFVLGVLFEQRFRCGGKSNSMIVNCSFAVVRLGLFTN